MKSPANEIISQHFKVCKNLSAIPWMPILTTFAPLAKYFTKLMKDNRLCRNKKIRIIYMIDTIASNNAGTEKQLLNIITRLNRNLFDVSLLCLYESPWMARNTLPCDVINLGYRGFLKPDIPFVLQRYLRLLNENQSFIVQTFFEDSMFVAYFGKKLSRNRHSLIISRRDLGLGADEPSYHNLYKKIRPHVLRSADGIAVNAHAIKDHIIRYENVPPGKITIIGNGLDIPPPPLETPTVFRQYQADIWVGIVANLKPIKRIDLLLRALGHLRDSGTKEVVRAVIIGDGKLKAELTKLAEDVGICDRVHFVGTVKNVSDYLYGMDIGVLCSDKEGLSNAILEYMACGLPVIATDAGGNSELVDESNGACIPSGDYIALAQALAGLIQSPHLRRELGNCSLEKARQYFTWDKIIPQWESYYNSLAANQSLRGDPTENAYAKT